jgi:hydrogenase maturation factor
MSKATIEAAKNYYKQMSVVKDALTAYKTGGVHAMHDPTEGGVIGGIYEMTMASNVGVKIVEEAITVRPETKSICNYFQIDPLQLISSGALLISAEPKSASKILRSLKQAKIPASVIGEFRKKSEQRIIVKKDGSYEVLASPVSDHLWTALKR